uniref:Histidine--tRNA ligase, chloroplastic n=1 Tax=Sheathia arcuata TaxID=340433 RepID=A0A3G1I8Y2_9FLOR|nr:histidine-tRNA synthetase [Sheathia arcuata]ART65402.1 histidine-tRNA synthetase [Sheathia arcuata]
MQSIRGMHDILPEEIKYWQYIYLAAIETFEIASYQEIRTPLLENTALFNRSIGENTDIINKEMYTFKDRGNRDLTLRPEGTASIARAVIEHNLCNNHQIQRLWYLAPMFRYERPQHGRQRQFHQLGIECIGSYNAMADAETIYLAQYFLNKLQCTDYSIEINSIGSIKDRSRYKLDLQKYLIPYIDDLDQESQTRLFNNTIRILDSKSQKTQEILNYAPKLINYLEKSTLEHFEEVTDYLESLRIQYTINTKIVRGLDYYNKTAFEIKSPLQGTQDTICGGGRYDNLIEQIGGPQIPAVGWAIGIERLLLIAKDQIKIQSQPLYYYIATEGYEAKKYILQIIPILQKYQIKFEIDFTNSNFQKQLKRANKKRAIMCLLISSYEVENNSITIKWLQEYQQESYHIKDFLDNLKNIKQKYH